MATHKISQPSFNQLTIELAEADAAAKGASSDASQARSHKSEVAVTTIKAAFSEKIDSKTVRETLLAAGVLKGTVSKIVTVLNGLEDAVLGLDDVKSLNGSYALTRAARAATAAAAAGITASATAFAGATPAVKATTPKEAIAILVDAVKSVKDPDEALKLAGEFITKVTNGLTAAVKSATASEEEE